MDHDSYRRNPTEAKIKGLDIEFLMWARDESQKRLFRNRVKRAVRKAWRKYSDPHKYVRKARSIWHSLTGGGSGTSSGGPRRRPEFRRA
ncbi:MAG: hypothetical protein Q9O62_01350 [Ardenticatenia bacterium]|nr:hypothetical protein [Ardenticatenia bacterium]